MEKSMRWYCNDCKRQFSAKVGTIFEDSPIPLTKWLPAIWLLASNRNGISSCEIARALKITQKSAWFMLHRLRLAMTDGSPDRFGGPVEVDETYVGGRTRHKVRGAGSRGRQPSGRKGMGPVGKTPVMGIVERKGKVRAWVIPSVRRKTLLPRIWDNVERGATIYTDAAHSYTDLQADYVHHVINHAYEYVREHVHTNNIEGFWSVLKRTLGGTYIAARPQHLQAYVEEQVFRFNEREEADGPRFAKATKGADGKRLTYKALTAK
jgi:transposase-like protein